MYQKPTQPHRPHGQTDVLELACPPIENVRIGLIGLGVRAQRAVQRFIDIEGATICGLCDIVQENIDLAQLCITKSGINPVDEYVGQDAWKQLCERTDIDLIYICTDWLNHTPMAVYAMQRGKHVAVEVPAATSVDECWQLVDTAEKTRKHCMMLENCCYDEFELNTLHMVQQGVFGEIMHAEGGYLHDLRERIFSQEYGKRLAGDWQNDYNTKHTGNPYPTHGLGPLCQKLNIHRGDRMEFLVSMSTDQKGMTLYAKEKFGLDSPQAQQQYKLGDMNSTLIRTARGKTILLQHDITSPRPYSRIQLISGTKGIACKYPFEHIALHPNADQWMDTQNTADLLKKHTHPAVYSIQEQAKRLYGDRARDYIMDYRLIKCLRKGLPLDQDVYDAAEWSCLTELCEQSVLQGSIPVEIPDFTRGAWNKIAGLNFSNL